MSRWPILVFVFTASVHLWAGAWVPRPKQIYFKIAYNDLSADEQFNAGGDKVKQDEFIDRNVQGYMELGLPHNIGLTASLAYKNIERVANPRLDNSGFGDLELGLRKLIWQGSGVFSAGLTVKLPFLYDRDDAFPLGNGQEDFELKVLYGRGFSNFYYGLEGGYRWRTDEPSDEWRYLLELGGSWEAWSWRSKLDGIESAKNGELGEDPTNPALFREFDSLKVELTAAYHPTARLGMEFTYTHPLSGRNTLAADQFQLGFVFQH